MTWRWCITGVFLAVSIYLLTVAGGKYFGADVPESFYPDPAIKQRLVFWGTIYFVLSVVTFLGFLVSLVRNVRRVPRGRRASG